MIKPAVVLLLAMLAGCTAVAPSKPQPLLLTWADRTCSGTAIASHAILTATHCFTDEASAPVVNRQPLTVVNRLDDGDDHTLLIVRQTFTASVQIAPMPGAGAAVHITGNPSGLRTLYARGTVAGRYHADTLLNLPIFYGDSGAAVLDGRNRIVGVISGVRVLMGDGVYVEWGETKPLRFSRAQWRAAGVDLTHSRR